MAAGDQLRVGQGFRDNDPRENGERVLFIVALNSRYAYVRSERKPHRRARILRSRLASAAYTQVGEFGSDASLWPEWFREDVGEASQSSPKGVKG